MDSFTIIELIATSSSLLCVWLSTRRHVLAWPVGIIGVLAYFYLFFQVRLYGDMLLQLVYLGQSIYGWVYWLGNNKAEEKLKLQKSSEVFTDPLVLDDISPLQNKSENTGLHHINQKEILYSLVGGVLGFSLLYILLTNAFISSALPLFDATTATLSLVANIWLARKIIENWLLWIVADILLIIVFMSKELYLSAGTYTIFLFLAAWGYQQWKKDLAKMETV